ncbi:hypothetical protein EIP91_005449 [Steccherinum ochraceum]|uniref:Uncharacterized protein n=1 Tax=Steccherinum ochraceum TaxID=92696 RepID=A0A4R0RVJ3_9APHY|nr:hypothetical protein EIP91_005449 [Steccherinum ochraceum]
MPHRHASFAQDPPQDPPSDHRLTNMDRPPAQGLKETVSHDDTHDIHDPSNEKIRPVSDAITITSDDDAPHGHNPEDDAPPSLNYTLHTPTRERWIAVFFALLFVESGILPLILFYSLQWGAHLSITKNLAIITSLIGTVSGLKVAQRTWFLLLKNGHESRRPIGAGRWGFDFFHILINVGLAAFFIPLIIGSSMNPASVPTVAMALPLFMLAICIPMVISSLDHNFRLPFRISSFPPYHPLPPLTYTIVEDVIAVDGGGGLEFRQAWRHRYEASRVLRILLRDVGMFWGISGILVAGACIAVAWTTNDDIGYGIGYGIPWLWAFVCTPITIVWAKRELERERREWHDVVHVHREKPLHLVETQDDREAYARMMARRSSSFSRVTRAQTMPATAARSGGESERSRSGSGSEGASSPDAGELKDTRRKSLPAQFFSRPRRSEESV